MRRRDDATNPHFAGLSASAAPLRQGRDELAVLDLRRVREDGVLGRLLAGHGDLLATLRSLWTDTDATYPVPGEKIWWEVWLRRHGGNELQRLMELAGLLQLEVADNRLQFEDRIVTLVRATLEQLSTSIDVLDDIAELRRAKETAKFFIDDLPPREQGEWAADLLRRTAPPRGDAPAVCILDTGVTRGHALLTAALAAEDCHAYRPQWKTDDHDGHGTEMAGLALYGDLTPHVASSAPIQLRHRLESVKILPPEGKNRPEMYGAITAEATSRVEIQDGSRRRCFSMSVGALDGRDLGQPTSWSAAVDALAAGRAFDPHEQGLIYLDDGVEPSRRLFLLSAGNVDGAHLQEDHLARCDVEVVHDPGQAWNALTVGAFTEKVNIQDPVWQGWSPVAQHGDLSPWSATGVAFDEDWPIKPEVVFEGGNVAKDARGKTSFPCPDLSLLSTYFAPAHRSFELTWATSAATPQVARMASLVWADYPTLWPEAVRALIVHSAEWTAPMRARLQAVSGKRKKVPLLCRYGYGVPQLDRALRSAGDSLTLISQGSLRPFNNGKLGEMHFFELPWPRQTLLDLGELKVRLRVTLSYFIEPNPGRRGWQKRYSYASHQLRFEVKGSTESFEEFQKRLNRRQLEVGEKKPTTDGETEKWHLGQARNRGSIHSDSLQCSAADLAERGVIGIIPESGWWKDQPKRDRSAKGARYALVVSIETDGVDTDLWTPVAQQVGQPIEISG
jgi:Subtilase family